MSSRVISAKSAEHYKWGGPQKSDCDGWHLIKSPGLSIIEELMPPGTSEIRHFHAHARQFFFVLEGELTLEVEQHDVVLRPGEGIEVASGERHQAFNRGTTAVRMLVISHPPSHGDRIEATVA
jgi:mannose-6-phosphate isomerase-like protein (cupin superfamily)